MTITCNAILQHRVDNRETFSLYYGQTFQKERESIGSENLLDRIYTVSSLEDLDQLPERLSYEDVWSQFVPTFEEGSSTTVFELTHYVVIFRRFIEDVGVPTRRVRLRIDP